MIIVSHRGLLDGPDPTLENNPETIDHALSLDYHVEIDLRIKNGNPWLGHDKADYEVDLHYLSNLKLVIHCKEIEALEFAYKHLSPYNYFWHENDKYTITNHGWLWAYPGVKLLKDSFAVLPELHYDFPTINTLKVRGVCSDYVNKLKD